MRSDFGMTAGYRTEIKRGNGSISHHAATEDANEGHGLKHRRREAEKKQKTKTAMA
jgi:hypothetical protein